MTREEARIHFRMMADTWRDVANQRELSPFERNAQQAIHVALAAPDDAERVETRTIRLGDTLYVDVDLRAAIDAARGK